jgi:hypothetical protein
MACPNGRKISLNKDYSAFEFVTLFVFFASTYLEIVIGHSSGHSDRYQKHDHLFYILRIVIAYQNSELLPFIA